MGFFGSKKNTKIKKEKAKSEEELYVEKLSVYKMPEKYLNVSGKSTSSSSSSSSSSGGSGKKTIIVIAIFVLILIVGAVIAFFFLQPKKNTQEPTPKKPAIQTNSNQNTNEEKNENANSNQNSNTNSDNTNVNSNTSAEQEDPDEPRETLEEDMPEGPEELKDASDTDSDGLSDKEEALFNTHLRNVDSDNDGFTDGEELLNLYDPDASGKKLEESNAIKKYETDYNFLYPAKWSMKEGDDLVVFSDTFGDTISVSWDSLKNPELIVGTFKEWYGKFATIDDSYNALLKTSFDGFDAYVSQDGFWTYLVDSSSDSKPIFIFAYDPTRSNIVSYKSTFQMMINSLKKKVEIDEE